MATAIWCLQVEQGTGQIKRGPFRCLTEMLGCFLQPSVGWLAFDQSIGDYLYFNGIGWDELPKDTELANLQNVGINTTADVIIGFASVRLQRWFHTKGQAIRSR